MEATLQRRVQRYGWDRAAARYESGWARQLRPAQALMLYRAAPRAGERVADIACGTGLVTLRAADAVGPTGCVVGTDISARMVEIAAGEARRLGIGHARFARMDAEALRLPDASVDVALNALGLMYVPRPEAALAEMFRVLVPGGRASVSVWGARERCGWASVFPIVEARVASDVCPMFFSLGTADTLARAMAAAGFTGLHTDRLSTTLDYADGDAACEAAFEAGPVALAWSRFDPRERAAAREDYLASIARWRLGRGYAVPGEFVVVTGSRPGP